MKNLKLIFLLPFLLFNELSLSQVDDTITKAYVAVESEEIDFSTIKKIQDPIISDFEGSYHFGESEGESQLEIIYSNGKLFARNGYHDWEDDNWVLKYDRVPVTFESGTLKVGTMTYSLYVCIETTEFTLKRNETGLVSHHYSNDGQNYHYVQFNSASSNFAKPNGRFPESSFVKLTTEDVDNLSKDDLKTMRNEIFARHGHIFKKVGKMDKYFSGKGWYKPTSEKCVLSSIEEFNVDFIRSFE